MFILWPINSIAICLSCLFIDVCITSESLIMSRKGTIFILFQWMHRAFKQDADGASSSLGTTRPPESRELFSDLSTVGGGGTNNGERPPKR